MTTDKIVFSDDFAVRETPWWAGQDSNLQPDRYERPALTIELPARRGARLAGIKRKSFEDAMPRRIPETGARRSSKVISDPRRSPPAAPPRFARR